MGPRGTGRGVVLEVEGDSALVLAPGGEFRWVRLGEQPREPGHEVTFGRTVGRAAGWWPAMRPVVATACIVLFVLGLTPLWLEPGPVAAYVSIDINPSMELGLDARGRVVEGIGLDPGGERLLAALGRCRGQAFEHVLSELVRLACAERLLGSGRDGTLVVAAVATDPVAEALLDRIEAAVRTVEGKLRKDPGGDDVLVATLRTEPALRQEAAQLGLSAGRYAVLLHAQAEGLGLEVADVREKPLGQVIRQAGGSPAQVMAEADRPGSLEDLVQKFDRRGQPLPPGLEKKVEAPAGAAAGHEEATPAPEADPAGNADQGGPSSPPEPPAKGQPDDGRPGGGPPDHTGKDKDKDKGNGDGENPASGRGLPGGGAKEDAESGEHEPPGRSGREPPGQARKVSLPR